jgi:hypothetical protein
MKDFTYTRQKHETKNVRYKLAHVANRLVELNIALRTIGEESKDLADFLQTYAAERNGQAYRNKQAAEANTRSRFVEKQKDMGAAFAAGKHVRQNEIDGEPDALRKLHHTIARWLLSAPNDDPEEIAPLIPAPVSMVKRVRVQLVDAGKLGPLHSPRTDPIVPGPQDKEQG